MYQLLRCLFLEARFPQAQRLGLIKMGLGIEQRSRRLHRFWEKHLEHSRAFQKTWLDNRPPEYPAARRASARAVVLGAGLLLDTDLVRLSQSFSEITLVDANPMLTRGWEKAAHNCPGTAVQARVLEISGRVHTWLQRLEEILAGCRKDSLEDIRHAIDDAACGDSFTSSPLLSTLKAPGKDTVVISLNVLSQLPILWRDAAERILRKQCGKLWVEKNKKDLAEALARSANCLIREHFLHLHAADPAAILLLTDVEYCTYKGGKNPALEPPLTCRLINGKGEWLNTDGVSSSDANDLELYDALYGVDVEEADTLAQLLPGHQLTRQDTWLWHIQPRLSEGNERGTINRVAAFAFERKIAAAESTDFT